MITLRERILADEFRGLAKERQAHWSENQVNNIVNNLAAHTSPELEGIIPDFWVNAFENAQLFDTYIALLEDFDDFKRQEYSKREGVFAAIQKQAESKKDKIKYVILETQKALRGIAYRDEDC